MLRRERRENRKMHNSISIFPVCKCQLSTHLPLEWKLSTVH
jgi:hypothetical protein